MPRPNTCAIILDTADASLSVFDTVPADWVVVVAPERMLEVLDVVLAAVSARVRTRDIVLATLSALAGSPVQKGVAL
jgi:hypothetical protein